MPEPRLPLTPAERAALRQKAELGISEDIRIELQPERLLALLDEVDALSERVKWLEAHRDMTAKQEVRRGREDF